MLRNLLFISLLATRALCAPPPANASQANAPRLTEWKGDFPTDIFHDDFYIPHPEYVTAKPGEILKWRPAPRPITLISFSPIRPKAAWQIQYRTQNSVGEPEATVVTVLVPYNAKPDSLFVQSFFTDSAFYQCNPSYALQMGNREDNVFTQMQTMVVIAALNQGWFVAVADDAGPQAAFPSGPQMAYATLDAIRAVKQSSYFTNIASNPITTVNGYSGGGLAAAWTSEIHPIYAPDVTIDGVSLGGIAPDLTTMVNGSVYAAVPAMLGISHDFKNLSEWIDANILPWRAEEFRKAETQCMGAKTDYGKGNIGQFFKRGLESILSDETPASIVRQVGVMGKRATPTAPWYLMETIADTLSPIKLTDKLVRQYCKNGADIYYERNLIPLDHASESFSAFPGAFQWHRDIHAGRRIIKGCRVTPVSLQSLWAAQTGLLSRGLMQNWLALLGVPINMLGDLMSESQTS